MGRGKGSGRFMGGVEELFVRWPQKEEAAEEVVEQQVVERVVEPVRVGDGWRQWWLEGDGKVYQVVKMLGGEARTPVPKKDMEAFLVRMKVEGKKLIKMPELEYKVPEEVLAGWGSGLLCSTGEALCAWGRKVVEVKGVKKVGYLAVVPEQEVGGASVDVKSWEKAIHQLLQRGFTRMGTVHTHPGGGVGASGTDMYEQWDKFGGIHYVL